MKRAIMSDLEAWKTSSRRKPLILRGARQVGKTWALTEFGRTNYENLAYFNFDLQQEFHQFFKQTKDPARIIENISAASAQPIFPEKTLVVFDEIQECPEAIASLKYFYEISPNYHIACAGSLLGIALSKPASFPVGKVNLLDMYPMNFTEFLMAENSPELLSYIDNINSINAIPDAFFNPLSEKLKLYFITGGMPEAVLAWTESGDMNAVQEILKDLLGMYELDFQKHASRELFPKIGLVWNSIPSQLARENKKFMYSIVRNTARAREYEDAVQWLIDSQLLTKVTRCSKPGLPISAYAEPSAFKLYALDVGILRRMCSLAPSAIAEGNRLFTEFKGALAENFVLQEIAPQFEPAVHYWAQGNPHYEVDFMIQIENQIVPIEVKSGESIKARSLKKYREKYPDSTPLAIRFSMRNLSFDDGLLNVPLFLAGSISELINIIKAS